VDRVLHRTIRRHKVVDDAAGHEDDANDIAAHYVGGWTEVMPKHDRMCSIRRMCTPSNNDDRA
jgi:hypothetical protein